MLRAMTRPRSPRATRLAAATARALVLALLLAGPVALGGSAGAQRLPPGSVPLEDLLQIQVRPHAVLAVDARGGGSLRADLHLGEQVRLVESRGAVGIVLTDQRLLAVSAGSAAFQDLRFRRNEQLRLGPRLGDRVALAATGKRLIGFDAGSGNLVESPLGVRERIAASDVGSNVAVAASGRRVFGLSPFRGGFFTADLLPGEELQRVQASGNLATVTTQRRILTFRADSGIWSERRLGLGH